VAAFRRLVLKRVGLADSGSDVQPLPAGFDWLNRLLKNVLLSEARYLGKADRSLPAGLSLVCIAQKAGIGEDAQSPTSP
jgi:hypothetical protein